MRGSWVGRLTMAAAAAILFAPDAWGQGSPILPETRSIHAGPVSIYPTMAVRDVGTDSNVYNDANGPRGDFTYSLTPRLFVTMPAANTRFVARALGTLTYYQTYKDQQAVSGLFDGRYEVVGPGFRPYVSAGFADRRERRGYEIDARLRQRQTVASVGADVDVTAVTAVTAWATRTTTRWDRNAMYAGVLLTDELDYTRSALAAGARLKVTPLTTVTAAAEFRKDRFDHTQLRDSDSLKVGPRVDFETTALVAGHLEAAYRSFKPLSSSVASFGGVVASAQLRYQFREWTEVEVEGERDVDYSYDPLQPYALVTGGRIEVTQKLVGPFGALVVGDRRHLDHQLVGEHSFNGRQEVTRTFGSGVALQFRKQLRFELLYERTVRTSSVSLSRAFERDRVVASAIYGQ